MHIASILPLIAALYVPSDSAVITLRSHDPQVPSLKWVAFDDARRPIARGVAPGVVRQATAGAAVTYCSDSGVAWLELVVEVGDANKGRMRAYGACTRVVVRGRAVQTLGVDDPRLSHR
jgi:hypothetical protein